MKVLQVTNIISHHQLPVARCIADAVGCVSFRFVATQPASAERIRLGWAADDDTEWILKPFESKADEAEFRRWWATSDIVLCGNRDLDAFETRLAAGKLVCYMSERWWKPPIGMARLFHPRFFAMALRFRAMAKSPALHLLAAGPDAASDIRRLTPLRERVWHWGYFPPGSAGKRLPRRDADPFSVLWAGRMLPWKRVDTLIRAFTLLEETRPGPRLTLVGHGPEEGALRRLVVDCGLGERVTFLPSASAPGVRTLMRNADVYVLPSNAAEGWGAVVNEAMSEGCAVVASEVAGAAKSLIRNGENGRTFRVGDWRELGSILRLLRSDTKQRERIAEAGRRTISDVWSPRVAADRFLSVSEALLTNRMVPEFGSGPMSRLGV